ncbi:hypothetical protein TWF970_005801 [Orbilia oligospora]|uniref:Uncharacterized protein n=1 Tax=Orbilia oligospora TaxID=2813651 RepID=A0A7C8VN81_ORBOL|nr:hypothetical protein TWF970_005801 [Orbilia oligospora]
MVAIQLLTSFLVALSAIAPKALCATLPHNPHTELDFGPIFDPLTFNDTSFESGSSVLDAIFNDPEIPFTETPADNIDLSGDTDHNNLEKRALKRYNYLKWKVTLTGYINSVNYVGERGNPVTFQVTSADVYVFDKIRKNAKDIIIKWRNPNGGQALPGCIYWMTNRRLYKFLAPGDRTEPNIYTDTVPTIVEKKNQLYAWETYRAGKDYNRWNQFSARYQWFIGWGLPDTIRSGGARFNWAATGVQKMNGEIYVQSLGYPYRHTFYYAKVSDLYNNPAPPFDSY